MALSVPPMLGRQKLLGVGVETTAGTPATVTAPMANSIIYDAKLEPDGLFDGGDRQPNGHYQGSIDSVLGLQKGKLSFKMELRHADAFMTLILGCGFSVTNGVASRTSTMANHSALTFNLWEGGRRKQIYGAAGTFSLAPEGPGKRIMADFSFDGIWSAPVDETMPAFAPVTGGSYRAAGMTLTIGAAAIPLVSTFKLELGNEVSERPSLVAATGLLHMLVEDHAQRITLDPEARLVATHDAYGLLLAGTTGALVTQFADSAGNTFKIDAARVQRLDIKDGMRDKKLTDEITLALHESAGDDSLKFTKTAAA